MVRSDALNEEALGTWFEDDADNSADDDNDVDDEDADELEADDDEEGAA